MSTIYLSSTYEELKDYRQVVCEALRKAGHQVFAMVLGLPQIRENPVGSQYEWASTD